MYREQLTEGSKQQVRVRVTETEMCIGMCARARTTPPRGGSDCTRLADSCQRLRYAEPWPAHQAKTKHALCASVSAVPSVLRFSSEYNM